MEREKGDGNTILLTVIGVATLLVALVGATFAYFSTQVNNESNQSLSITTAAPAGLQYVGQKFEMTNILPGSENTDEQGTFTVENPGTIAQTYDLTLKVDEDTLVTTDGAKQLLLSITSTNATVAKVGTETNVETISNGLQWDMTDGAEVMASPNFQFVKTQRIEGGQTQTYLLKLNFVNLDTAQDTNQGKSFRAHVDLSNAVSVK